MGEIFWIVVIYIASELLIWCLSLALRLAGLQFLSSILGMLLVFASMVSVSQLRPGSDGFYRRNIKSKVRLNPVPSSNCFTMLTRPGRFHQQQPRRWLPCSHHHHNQGADSCW